MKPSVESTYPVSLDLRDKAVLLVGGGDVAFRKAQGLAKSGCRLTVIAPEFAPAFQAWLEGRSFDVERRAYREGEAASFWTAPHSATSRSLPESSGATCRWRSLPAVSVLPLLDGSVENSRGPSRSGTGSSWTGWQPFAAT